MAAPTFVQAGTGVVITTGNQNPGVGSANIVAGDLCILQVLQDGTTASAVSLGAVGNIENLAGTDNAITVLGTFNIGTGPAALQHLWIGRAMVSDSPCSTVVATTGDDLYCRFYTFRGVSTGTTLATVIENNTAGGTNTATGNDTNPGPPSLITTGADRLGCAFVGINDDNAMGDFTGETFGNWVEATAEYAEATGTDGCIQLQTQTIASATTVSGGSFAMAAADPWGVTTFALIPAAVAYVPRNAGVNFQDPGVMFEKRNWLWLPKRPRLWRPGIILPAPYGGINEGGVNGSYA